MRTCAILFALLTSAAHAEIVDRVAVSAGTQAIALSSVLLEIRVDAFLEQTPVVIDGLAKRKAAARLLDQFLILREADESLITLPTSDKAVPLVNQVKAQYSSPAEYEAQLKRYGITESDLAAHLLAGLKTLTFTDLRFRPITQVTDEDLRAYYDTLKAKQPDTPAPPFESSREQIEKLLINQRISDALDDWLKSARDAAHPIYREAALQ